MSSDPCSQESGVRALLEHLTGPSRGSISWLAADCVIASVGHDRRLHLRAEGGEPAPGRPVARLTWSGEDYAVEAIDDQRVWVNGQETKTARLRHGDVIEFGETGPISRLRLCTRMFPIRWSLEDMVGDAIAYVRASRKPLGPRLSTAATDVVRRIAVETTLLFRATVILVIIGLIAFGYSQYLQGQRLEESIRQEAIRLEGIAAALAQARREALTRADLRALREDVELRVSTNAERLRALERRSEAAARIISGSIGSIALLQGAYGVRHIATGRLLRHVLGPGGTPLITPFGQPMLSPDGTGPPVEIQFTGTGFVVRGGPQLVTNLHVATPWAAAQARRAFAVEGLEPEILKLVAYLPGHVEPIDARVARVSDAADLAILELAELPSGIEGLALAGDLPQAGEEVIVMGYPAGLRSLLAQSGAEFLKSLEAEEDADFWKVAVRLSERGMIVPLASRGIIGKVAAEAIVYDAETTYGGSGGPVLNSEGEVVAVNAAILPEFGGSNIGVPVARLREILEAVQD